MISQKLKDFIIWQRIKYQNRKNYKIVLVEKWIAEGKKIPPPHVVKQEVVEYFQKNYSIKTLVETGTFRGEMVYAQKNNFEEIYSIELSTELFKTAKNRLKKFKHIKIIQGDSGEILKDLVKEINHQALFWLDGHYSGFETAKGSLVTPVIQELEVILSSSLNHFILIDDARLFTGENDYPTLDELKKYILDRRSDYLFNVEDDVIRIYYS